MMTSKWLTIINGVKHFMKTDKGYAISGMVIGMLLFLMIYGFAPLVPTNVSFLYDSTDFDLMSHQFGFDFYRYSDWSHPIGETASYPYPYISSVINSDSIPLFAIPCKILSPVLPAHFQYMGIWHLFCFAMQGLGAALIFRKAGIGYAHTVVSVPLFICNVPLLFRCFHHSSLVGQWLILFVFLLIMEQKKMSPTKKTILWCVLCALSVLIHGYLFIIVGVLMTLSCIYCAFFEKKVREAAMVFICCVISTVPVYYEAGGTVVHSNIEVFGLGKFTLDLFDILNPQYSSFFKPFYESSSEGTLYLGTGIIVLLVISAVLFIKDYKSIKNAVIARKKQVLFLTFSVIVLTILSLGVCGQFAGKVFYDIRPVLPEELAIKLSMLRSTARFIWPVWYLFLIGGVILVSKRITNFRISFVLLMLCLVLQYADVVPVTAQGGTDKIVNGYDTELSHAFDGSFSSDAVHLTLMGPAFIRAAADFAAQHRMSVNASKVGRGPKNSLQIATDEFNTLTLSRDSVYVIGKKNLFYLEPVDLPSDYSIYLCDDLFVIFYNDLLVAPPGGEAELISSDEFLDYINLSKSENDCPEPITNYEDI